MINTYVIFYYTAKDLFILENQILTALGIIVS